MKLIAGLGNPGDKYEFTRHNAGFIVVSKLAEKFNITGKFDKKLTYFVMKNTVFKPQKIWYTCLEFRA